ncbi:MAG: efflux RND transporter periplasmic adaptor subunit [Hyphomicrobiaceae bacterium]
MPVVSEPTSPGLRSPIEVNQTSASKSISVFFAVLIVAVMGGLWFGSFSKQQPVRGFVSAASGLVRIASPGRGTVTRVLTKQGEAVKRGQALLTVKAPDVAAGNEQTRVVEQQNLQRRRTNLMTEMERIERLVDRLRKDRDVLISANADLNQTLDRELSDLGVARREASNHVGRLRPLLASRDVSRDRVTSHERALRDYERMLSETLSRKTENLREHTQKLATLDASLAEKATHRATLANELAEVETRLNQSKANDEFTIVAGQDGIVASLTVATGSSIEGGQVVVVLGDPAAEQIIILEAPAGAMGLVASGQRVTLKYDAFPFKTFGIKMGTVVDVAQASVDSVKPGSLSEQGLIPAARGGRQTVFQISVRPDANTILAYGEERRIALGSTLTADITIERRRLIDWVIDPILALRGRS